MGLIAEAVPGATRTPSRLLVALAVLAVLAALIVLALTVLPRSRSLPFSGRVRTALAAGILLVLVVLAVWIVVILPAYWD